MYWHVSADSMTEMKSGKQFQLWKHGLTAEEARLAPAGTRFIVGFIPLTREISGDTARLREVLSEVSTTGDHFTYFASEFRKGADRVILLDYVKGSPDPLKPLDPLAVTVETARDLRHPVLAV